MKNFAALLRDDRGAAAAEMAMVAPLLIVLMFSSLEAAKFFWDEHIVLKSVRDGARFASRQSFANMPCGGPAANETAIKNQVRFGSPVASDTPRLSYWNSDAGIDVQIECYDNTGTGSTRIYGGIYGARPEVPIVKVVASVPYTPIVGMLGFNAFGINLNAQSEATVYGI